MHYVARGSSELLALASRSVPRGSVPEWNTRLRFSGARVRYRLHYGAHCRRGIVHLRPPPAVPSGEGARERSVSDSTPRRPPWGARLWPISPSDAALLHLAPPWPSAQGRDTHLPHVLTRELETRAVRAVVGPALRVLCSRARRRCLAGAFQRRRTLGESCGPSHRDRQSEGRGGEDHYRGKPRRQSRGR